MELDSKFKQGYSCKYTYNATTVLTNEWGGSETKY